MQSLPATEPDAVVRQRIGQDLFRQGLLALWQGRCALTGLAVPELLRASHAKPWKVATDAERLDVYNGLLLAAHLDAAFDQGFIAFGTAGELIVSPRLGHSEGNLLGLDRSWPALLLRRQHAPTWLFTGRAFFRGEPALPGKPARWGGCRKATSTESGPYWTNCL